MGAPTESKDSLSVPDEQITGPMKKAIAELKAGRIDACLELLREGRKTSPGSSPAELTLARLLFSGGRPAEGRRYLEKVAVQEPDNPDVLATFADLARQERRWTDAWILYEKTLALPEPKVWSDKQRKLFRGNVLSRMTHVAENRADWPSAERVCRQWLALDEKAAGAHLALGRALFFLDQTDAAMQELRQARKLDEKLPPAELTIGLLWDRKQNPEEAERWIKAAIDKEPKHAASRLEYVTWLLGRRRVDQAREQLDSVSDAGPLADRLTFLKGLIARHHEDYTLAEQCFSELHRNSPADFVIGNQLALTLVEQPDEGKRSRALQIAQSNAQRFPRLAEALSTLGWVQFRLGNPQEAEKALRAATSSGHMSPDTAYFLAQAAAGSGNMEDARRLLKVALDATGLFVNRRSAERWLQQLGAAKSTSE